MRPQLVVGVDIGGTTIKGVLAGADAAVLARNSANIAGATCRSSAWSASGWACR